MLSRHIIEDLGEIIEEIPTLIISLVNDGVDFAILISSLIGQWLEQFAYFLSRLWTLSCAGGTTRLSTFVLAFRVCERLNSYRQRDAPTRRDGRKCESFHELDLSGRVVTLGQVSYESSSCSNVV